MAKDKDPQNKSRIVIEEMPEPEKRVADKYGRINPWTKKWHESRMGRRRESRRA